MKLSLKKGEKIIVKNPTNCYRLTITSMSGDADAYNTNHFDDLDEKEILDYINIIITSWQIGDDKYDEYKLIAAIESKGEELGYEYPMDVFGDLVGYDVTCEGEYASLDEIKVTYFNEHGIEFKVDVVADIEDEEIIVGRYSIERLNMKKK